jgi:chromosomal replication initiation ATPase DnaA
MSAFASILTLRETKQPEPTLEAILQAVAQEMRVPVKQMQSRRRFNEYSRARLVYYYAAHCLTSQKEEAIASVLHKERSTASYGKMVVERDRERFEPGLSRVLSRFTQWRQAA